MSMFMCMYIERERVYYKNTSHCSTFFSKRGEDFGSLIKVNSKESENTTG